MYEGKGQTFPTYTCFFTTLHQTTFANILTKGQIALNEEETVSHLYLCISEEEDSVFVFDTSHVVELFNVVVKGQVIVTTTQFYLEALVTANMCTQSVK